MFGPARTLACLRSFSIPEFSCANWQLYGWWWSFYYNYSKMEVLWFILASLFTAIIGGVWYKHEYEKRRVRMPSAETLARHTVKKSLNTTQPSMWAHKGDHQTNKSTAPIQTYPIIVPPSPLNSLNIQKVAEISNSGYYTNNNNENLINRRAIANNNMRSNRYHLFLLYLFL